MAKKIFLPKNVLLLLIWLFFLGELSWCDSTQEISLFDNPSQSDTLKISDKWFARDKVEHLGVSAFLSGVSYSVFRDFYHNRKESSIYFSTILAFSAGLGKEFYDKKTPKGKFSYKDLVVDILGIGLGLLIATR
jgi:uncharacterized protein YfiM (DUF2279 family)